MRLVPGKRFALTEHPNDTLNQPYVALRVEHEGRHPEAFQGLGGGAERDVYRNRFSCLPAETPARPRRPKRRLQQVMETATVVGPGGEEIYTDEFGRIKVQFHWDAQGKCDERSSCWIRTMQPWAGAAWGFQFIPRIGMEVVVAFSGGDTDRPLVLGTAYNGVAPPPFPLPENKTQSGIRTRSSPGGQGSNELMFEDAAGREQIFLHAQRDLQEVIERDHRRTVRGEEAVTVDGGRETTIAKDHVRTVLGNEIVQIEKNMLVHIVGRQIIQIDGRMTADEPGGEAASLEGEILVAAAAAPEGEAAVEGAAAALDTDRGAADAMLLWQTLQLPPELQAEGSALKARTVEAIGVVAALRDQATAILRTGQKLLQRAARKEGLFIDIGPTLALSDAAVALEDEIARVAMSLTEKLTGMQAPGDPRLAKVNDAAAKRLRSAIIELERFGGDLSGTIRETRIAQGLPDVRGIRSEPLPRVQGSAKGGGGAITGLDHRAKLSFLGPPDTLGQRGPLPVLGGGGSRIGITGGGEIDSPQGFRIKSGDCFIEMSAGILTLNAPTICLAGDDISVQGKVISVGGSAVTVKGDFIMLN